MALRQAVGQSRWSKGGHAFVVSGMLLAMGLLLDGCETIGRIAHGDPSVLVVIKTEPAGARVIIDGKELGESPVSFQDSSGSFQTFSIEIRKEGYEPVVRALERKFDTMRLTHRLDPVYFYTLYPASRSK